ncbi:MAG: hypothetical protein MUF62_09150 [Chitinophagaceae bacterium]|nr:hypothetical protein [Chitinophagaceae bacterium]
MVTILARRVLIYKSNPLMKLFVSTSRWWPVLLVALVACQKQVGNPNNGNPNPVGAIRLTYSDSIFFLRSTAAANLINPTTRPTAPGYFIAIPKGLSIDSATGRINLAASETGIRYKVYYVPTGSNRATDSVRLVVSGVDYEDRIYSIEATPLVADTAFPIYNANPSLRPPCSEDDDDDDDGCMFDETDLNADGNDDIAGVIQDKLLVNKGLGTIDLEASFNAGLFGSQSPANGTERTLTMYYRLNDASLRALNKIDIRVIYYERRSDIPLSLQNELNRRRTSRVLGREVITPGVTGTAQRQVELRTLVSLIRSERAREKRPPMIILTKSL